MRAAALAFAVLLVLSGVTPQTVAGLVTSDVAPDARQSTQTGTVSPPKTTFDVQLYGNQSARWNVTMSYALDGESEREAFRRFAREYAAGNTKAAVSVRFFTEAASQAASHTDRQMTVRNVSRSWEITNNGTTGALQLTFEWTNFLARSDNQTLVLHDALMTGSNETWLRSLGDQQTLIIRPPPDYRFTGGRNFHTQRIGNGGQLVIDGPEQFSPDEQLTMSWAASGGDGDPGQPFPLTFAVGAGILFLLVIGALVGGYTLSQRRSPLAPSNVSERITPTDGGSTTAESVDGVGEAGAAEAGKPDDANAEPSSDEGSEPEVDLSLLSDEERVEHLLESNGGRMKQANIVKETGWSDAKVSQLLSKMDDESQIEKLRLGRENLISLPDEGDEGDGGDGANGA